jgi:hypothetical protein
VVEIKSAEVSVLTSPGLGELKRLINEAGVKRRELSGQVEIEQEQLDRAHRRLRFARSFIVRLFTRKSVPGLIVALDGARERLEDTTAERDGCYIEVDFGFDDTTLNSYAALVRAFEALSSCQRIWDITTTKAIDRVRERTAASTALSRTSVRFDFASPEIVKVSQQVMRMGNVSGKQLYWCPGFLMMRDSGADFALIEYKEVQSELAPSHFVEEETVPTDAEVVGQTWKKANKDGSPDRRFKDNYSIPIVLYGALSFESGTGLQEVYQFSDFKKTRTFSDALSNHRKALAAFASADHATSNFEAPSDQEDDDPEPQAAHVPAVSLDPFVFDWIALVAAVVGLAFGANWTLYHRAQIDHLMHPTAVEAPVAPPVAPAPPPAVHKHHKKGRHHPAATPPTSDPAPNPNG